MIREIEDVSLFFTLMYKDRIVPLYINATCTVYESRFICFRYVYEQKFVIPSKIPPLHRDLTVHYSEEL